MLKPLKPVFPEGEREAYENAHKTHSDDVQKLKLYRGKAYSQLLQQSVELLLDAMKKDKDWESVQLKGKPLLLLDLMEKTVLGQTDDKYPCAVAFESVQSLLSFTQQENQEDTPYYESFNKGLIIWTKP